jgi:hypothetical protein
MPEQQKQCTSSQPTQATVRVSTGEYCTIETAKEYDIFGIAEVINREKIPQASNIDILEDNKVDPLSKYSLCKLNSTGTIASQNCVLTTRNPWKTLNDAGECTLPYKIKLPSELKYLEGSKTTIEKPGNIPILKEKKDCLQERWYDWFSIPDYHLGNKYSLNSSNLINLKPCSIGFIPSTRNPDKCTSKADFKDGKFEGMFNYTPLALIHLLGNTKQTLMNRYNVVMSCNLNKLSGGTYYADIHNYLTTDKTAQDDMYNIIQTDLQANIQALMNQPFDDRNIIAPYFDDKDLVRPSITKDRVDDAYKIASDFCTLETSNVLYPSSTTALTNFNDWKTNLKNVSGYESSDSKFHKQIMTLKKACSVCFDNKTDYSKSLIKILNTGRSETDIKQPLSCTPISSDDRIRSLSNNVSENPVEEGLQRRDLLLQQDEAILAEASKDQMELKKIEYDPVKYGDEVHEEAIQNPVAENIVTVKNIVMAGVFIIMALLFFGILYILASILWEPLAYLMNTVILGFYVGILKVKDTIFRSSDDPPSYDKEILTLQKKFIENKIINDEKKYM